MHDTEARKPSNTEVVEAGPSGEAPPFRCAAEWEAHVRWRAVVNTKHTAGDMLREVIGAPIDKLEDLVFRGQRVSGADRVVAQSFRILNSLATRGQSVEAVRERYRQANLPLGTLKEIRQLSLEEISRALPAFDNAYALTASASGGITGAFGVPGAVMGLPTLLLVALHAIGSYACHFGHDLTEREEQEFAVMVLIAGLVSRPSQRSVVIERLEHLAFHLERGSVRAMVETETLAILENVAEAAALRLLVGLLVRSWPGVGVLLGAGFSRAFVNHVCGLALAAYEQRWLLRFYGDAARVATPKDR